MGCFPCTGESSIKRQETKRTDFNNHGGNHYRRDDRREPRKGGVNDDNKDTSPSASRTDDVKRASVDGYSGSKCRAFKFSELECATDNFKPENFLGEGGFGKVYKGCLVDTGQIVAIKQLDHNGGQGSKEFCVEVKSLNRADHPNLVKLIGCCAEGVQRVLVYEYMPLGSLEDHLHGRRSNRKRLDWNTRMNIAAGAARGLEYLHTRMEPPIIYRDLKCSNILLGEGYHPKLSDFGLAKDGPCGDDTHVSTRVMGTYGYCAPDYAMTGQLTFKSDIYSFGVVLLEIITGRKAIDNSRSSAERNLVDWAKPLFKNHVNFPHMADPALEGQFPRKGLIQALSIAAICIVDDAIFRPPVADVVSAMNYIASQTYDPNAHNARTTKKCSSSHTP